MVWAAGDTLQAGKYTVERELGRGRLGITYLARDKDHHRLVIKTLNDTLLTSLPPEERNRLETKFNQEAVKLRSCIHPHIVKVRELFKEGERWCIALEYVDGMSLAERSQKVLSEVEALNYIQQIGEALIVVHHNHLIHRDVKPGNIIVRVRGGKPEAVLIDFDLALDVQNQISTVRTQEASDGFAPVELYSRQAQNPGEYTDVYSLAATLYELLTGNKPVSAIKRKLDRERLVPPKDFNIQNNLISDRTNRMILWGMELEPKKRPQSVREWLDSLGLITQNSTPLPSPPPSSGLSLEQKILIWTLIATLIGSLGALLGGIGDFGSLFKPDSPASPTSSPTRR
ncbi:MAG TPA: serine/threonine protein kinase [Cyanobacteria bacterium UBA11370]|nr:serine/threonine protein kinase [Cyanobacteria bacterium UBA11370]HBY76727.1 serine/threonine protein kinase [Cyanobacteria bacterium UBA11148]